MSARKRRRAAKRLQARIQGYTEVPMHLRPAFRRPGSQNPKK
jgi:hypothetical protein